MSLWLLTAALSGVPLLGDMLASFSAAVTFIAVTTGFGAVLLSYWRGEVQARCEPDSRLTETAPW